MAILYESKSVTSEELYFDVIDESDEIIFGRAVATAERAIVLRTRCLPTRVIILKKELP